MGQSVNSIEWLLSIISQQPNEKDQKNREKYFNSTVTIQQRIMEPLRIIPTLIQSQLYSFNNMSRVEAPQENSLQFQKNILP